MTPVRAFLLVSTLFLALAGNCIAAGGRGAMEPPYPESDQFAVFPLPLLSYESGQGGAYPDPPGAGIWEKLKHRAGGQHYFNLAATIIFFCAIIHTFIVGVFKGLAQLQEARHRKFIAREKRRGIDKPQPDARDDVSFRAHLFHTLGEVEAIFGMWVLILGGAVVWFFGLRENLNFEGLSTGVMQVKHYLGHDVSYTEPLFLVVIMAIAATRPVIRLSEQCVNLVAQLFGGSPAAWWFATLTLTPLLGSFITEPAAMTIAALLLAKHFYQLKPGSKFAYATIGLLFVNISVGGTLTHFAAPPVLMVAAKWDWGLGFMMSNFGWKAALGILGSNLVYFLAFRKEFRELAGPTAQRDMHLPLRWEEREDAVPGWVTMVHLLFLAWTVFTAHYPPLFIGGFMLLIGFTEATGHHQNDVRMRTPLLVGFFLAGLVIHGGCQGWWIQVLLTSIENDWLLMIGSTTLTAFNDNAAVTYLAAQAPGIGAAAKYAVVAGAVTGGGLTVIANAPNPAGQAILGRFFEGGVSPLKLAIAALIPTLIFICTFMLLPTSGMKNAAAPLPPDPPARVTVSAPPGTPAVQPVRP